MLKQIGLLNEGLYTYCDDTDICLWAKRAGWKTWFVPQSWVIHDVGTSTGVTVEGKEEVTTPGLLVPAPTTVFPCIM